MSLSNPFFYLGRVVINQGWTQLGTGTVNTSYGGSLTGHSTCIVNGRFCVLCPCHGPSFGQFKGWVMFMFDDDGSVCTYQSPDYPGDRNIQSFQGNVVQAGNRFNVSTGDGANYSFTIPTFYQAGAVLTIPYISNTPPQGPCGVGSVTRSIYIDNLDLTAFEFVVNHSVANDTWVSFYRGNTFVSGGYLGNYPAAYEPFYRFSQSVPPGQNGPFYKNGAYIYGPDGTGFGNQYLTASAIALKGNYSQLVCGGIGDPNVYVTADRPFSNKLSNVISWTYNGNDMEAAACTDIPLTYALVAVQPGGGGVTTNVCVLFNQFQLLELSLQAPIGGLHMTGFGAIQSKKKVYIAVNDAFNKFFQVWSAPLTVIPSPPANLAISQHDGLYNYHRAVSPDGTFQA